MKNCVTESSFLQQIKCQISLWPIRFIRYFLLIRSGNIFLLPCLSNLTWDFSLCSANYINFLQTLSYIVYICTCQFISKPHKLSFSQVLSPFCFLLYFPMFPWRFERYHCQYKECCNMPYFCGVLVCLFPVILQYRFPRLIWCWSIVLKILFHKALCISDTSH